MDTDVKIGVQLNLRELRFLRSCVSFTREFTGFESRAFDDVTRVLDVIIRTEEMDVLG